MKKCALLIVPVIAGLTPILGSTTVAASTIIDGNYEKLPEQKDYIKEIPRFYELATKPTKKVIEFKVGQANKELHPEQYPEPKKEEPKPESAPVVQAPVQEQAQPQPQVQQVTQPQAQTHPQVQQQAQPAQQVASAGTQVKVTFYDPAVLGAGTMPGGLYSGVAANLSTYPKGTVLQIKLPDGQVITRTVNDTGVAPQQEGSLDIAMPNGSIPSYGTGTATVSVIG